MKNRFTLFVLLMCLLIPCFLTACGGGDDQVEAIRKYGELRVGVKVDVPRFGYLNPAPGEIEGLEIDIARAIAKDILGDENAVKFTGITAQTRAPLLENGEIDLVIATFTITEERKLSFNFSDAYYTDELGYLLLADSPVTQPEGLDGKTVGVAQGSTAIAAFEGECERMGIDVALNEYASYPEIKMALVNGEVTAFIGDKSILYGYLDDQCVLLPEGFNPQPYGIASKLGNDQLAAHINALLEAMEESGELAAIIEKWGL
jgi:putative glutamine transport system substrate-binding protein